jgi:hypothetical protein
MTTNQDSIEAYKKAIRLQYEVEKNKMYSSFLLSPSRAQLRNLCIERLKNSDNLDDLKSFSLFFGFEFNSGNLNRLKSQTDKFRPIETFFKGVTDLSDIEGMNLASILVDYKSRPFRKFINSDCVSFEGDKIKPNTLSFVGEIHNQSRNLMSRLGIGAVVVFSVLTLGYIGKDLALPNKKECMQWQENGYVMVECNSEKQELISQNEVRLYDRVSFELKKIKVCDTTVFFNGDKATVWYCKVNGQPEFFTNYGIHPLTGKALKPITKYIINKYVKK